MPRNIFVKSNFTYFTDMYFVFGKANQVQVFLLNFMHINEVLLIDPTKIFFQVIDVIPHKGAFYFIFGSYKDQRRLSLNSTKFKLFKTILNRTQYRQWKRIANKLNLMNDKLRQIQDLLRHHGGGAFHKSSMYFF